MAVNKVLAASCLLACSVIGQAQAADAFTVKDIRIEGLQRVTLGAALLNLPIRVGDKLDSNSSANAVKRLYSTGNFDDIKMSRDGDVLVVQVKERPTISQIEFEGNKDIKEDQLKQTLGFLKWCSCWRCLRSNYASLTRKILGRFLLWCG